MESCETSLSSSGIEISTSGTTGVLLVIESDLIHVGSVGDSRSVLATTA